ncbi:AAA family ATPase [Roseibium aggregatum]|uniref:AAA family ATPase n=1 Tax=Roseibium aggregatum TaxID=187304 RepID=UPI003A96E1DA
MAVLPSNIWHAIEAADNRSESYAVAALDDECRKVATAVNGTRNNTLNSAVFSLAQLVAGGELSREAVEARLSGAALAAGLSQDEITRTFASGFEAGSQKPRTRPEPAPHVERQAPAHAPERTSKFYSAAALKDKPVPIRPWLANNLIPLRQVTLLSGDGGTGKSLAALHLAVKVAAGLKNWLGNDIRGGRVIFLSAEDDEDELHRRLADIVRAEGIGFEALEGLTLRSLAGEDALLAIETKIALMESELFKELDARANEESPVLIVLDTLADVYPANENDRAKVRQFVGILRGLALKRNCAVLLLGHPSLTGLSTGSGSSGSTAWNNSVRSRLYLSRVIVNNYEPDPDVRILSTKKANYGRTGATYHLRWQEGVFVSEDLNKGMDEIAQGATAERVFLKLLAKYEAQGRRVNASGGTTYAPKVFAEHPDNEGVTKRAFATAMNKLLSDGFITVQHEGPPSRRVSYLEVKA